MADFVYTDSLKTITIASTISCGQKDVQDLLDALAGIDSLACAVTLAAGILAIVPLDAREFRAVVNADKLSIATGKLDGHSYVLSAAGNANGVYTGTIGATAKALVGKKVLIAGFSTSANNGSFIITDNNGSTTITTSNLSSATESHAGTAQVDSVTADTWTAAELLSIIAFVRAARRIINQFTITTFTVVYA